MSNKDRLYLQGMSSVPLPSANSKFERAVFSAFKDCPPDTAAPTFRRVGLSSVIGRQHEERVPASAP